MDAFHNAAYQAIENEQITGFRNVVQFNLGAAPPWRELKTHNLEQRHRREQGPSLLGISITQHLMERVGIWE